MLQTPESEMKQKTIVLRWYHIWGTHANYTLELRYGRKVLHHIPGHSAESERLFRNALTWAKNQGYTHWRMYSEMKHTPLNVRKLEV